jgi:hypothetical protein
VDSGLVLVAITATLSAAGRGPMLAPVKPEDVIRGLALPPRLTVRALDDLHTIARAARDISVALYQLEQRAEAVGRQLDTAVSLIGRIESLGEQALAIGEQVDARAQALLKFGERIDARAAEMLGLFERVDEVATAVIDQGSAIETAAREVAARGAAVADALPPLQRALEIAEPLEGIVERLGRVVDLLPGGGRRPPAEKAR